MATYKDIINGLLTLEAIEGEDKHGVCAEHDELWAGHTPPDELTSRQLAILDEAGWEWVEDISSWRRWV